MNMDIVRRMAQVFLTLLIQSIILFVSAGTLSWNWAWIFIVIGIFILVINYTVLPREVIEERGREKKNVKKWDKILMSINIVPILGIYVLSGLDYRFSWSPYLHYSIHILGIIAVFLGSMLFTWSMVSNKFFSTMVRIQDERGHSIAAEGPYRYVRHPGYVGYIVMAIATPLTLGSIYALLMSFLVMIIFIIRTILEDKTLLKELEGYKGYSKKVKYRLIPCIWLYGHI
ncbi:MAG: isoprenylcysteine carboxylmethyltransferase family protein [Atribacterota bacterium]|jgi:protein-S-isoprenylcysteine O-methyltransferase Ste14|nr:isoprenylcysteine carboxylmethyltransferase family protein [Atribacterota bacterium]MDD4895612.1 isoprenylcysteine carboxylmethyltransferase family protein [Atribacterota bacterium]MDD5637268.1 isoprenylcysteine carboxylmethyltransferase family protein [Atribacterota bacterium]